jgi:hypothetical protein
MRVVKVSASGDAAEMELLSTGTVIARSGARRWEGTLLDDGCVAWPGGKPDFDSFHHDELVSLLRPLRK